MKLSSANSSNTSSSIHHNYTLSSNPSYDPNPYVVHCQKSPYDVYIGRASKGMPKGETAVWGNPFVMKNQSDQERARVTNEYRQWIYSQPDLMEKVRNELKGKILGCWCSPKQCHGNVLAEIANSDEVASTTSHATSPLPVAQTVEIQPQKKGKKKSQLQTYKAILTSSEETPTPNPPPSSALKSISSSSQQQVSLKPPLPPTSVVTSTPPSLYPAIDIGININSQLKSKWKTIIKRALDVDVNPILLTGTSVDNCRQNLSICYEWNVSYTSSNSLFCTIGIHPHHASQFSEATLSILRSLIEENRYNRDFPSCITSVVAVGECGLDFFRNLSTHEEQITAFTHQINLAREYNLPLFVHDREATSTVLEIFSSLTNQWTTPLPPVVIHCFTGTEDELLQYLAHDFYIGITGIICKYQRGKALREMLHRIPLDRLMVETDAPYMGFRKDRRNSEPADVVAVIEEIAKVLGRDIREVRQRLYQNTVKFFRLPSIDDRGL